MARTGLFAKQLARKLKEEELAQVSGGVVISRTFRPVTCHVNGGYDWNDEGVDFEAY